MKKLDNGILKNAPKNGAIEIDGVKVVISNLDKFLEQNKDIANSLGYYDYEETTEPEYDNEKQYLNISYEMIGDKIKQVWNINNYTDEEIKNMKRFSLETIEKYENLVSEIKNNTLYKLLPSWIKEKIEESEV